MIHYSRNCKITNYLVVENFQYFLISLLARTLCLYHGALVSTFNVYVKTAGTMTFADVKLGHTNVASTLGITERSN